MELSHNAANLKSDLMDLAQLKGVLRWIDIVSSGESRAANIEDGREQLRLVSILSSRKSIRNV